MRPLPHLLLPAIFALAACGQGNAPQTEDTAVADVVEETVVAETFRYACPNGSIVDASYPTPDTAVLLYEGETIHLENVVSASGARYVGDGWQWWTKGSDEGTLSRLQPGEETASEPGLICTAL